MSSDSAATRSCWLDLGDVAVIPLVEKSRLLIEPEEFFPQLAGERSGWCFEQPWYDAAAARLVYAIQSFLVVTTDRIVLVDACVGDAKPRVRPEFDNQRSCWLDGFAATGIDTADVSAVLFTHLHVDHVGWATHPAGEAWTPVFPNAGHYVTKQEYDYWVSTAGRSAMRRTGDYLADSVLPLVEHDLLAYVSPTATFGHHIRLLPAFGHTPGHVCVMVSGSDADLLIVGDLLHHPVQLRHPKWSTRYCVDRQQAAQSRCDTLDRLAASGTPMLPAHFPFPSAGRVEHGRHGFSFEPAVDIIRTSQYTRWRIDGATGL